MIDGVLLEYIRKYEDPRGWLAEIYRHDQFDYVPAMGYLSWTKKDVCRGPHEHVYQSDLFVFIQGVFRMTNWDNRPPSRTYKQKDVLELGGDRPAAIMIPPGVVHAYRCISPEGGLVINLPDRLYKSLGKKLPVDEIRHEENPDSPFQAE